MNSGQDKQDRHLQQEADRTKQRPKLSVLGYITILFAAAFLLLLLSYLMQQRNNEEVISGLKESVSAVQSIQNLQAKNDELSAQVDALEQALEQKTGDEAEAQRVSARLEMQVYALDWLREIQSQYAAKRYKAARAMLEEFSATGLTEYLPDYSLHTYDGSDALSPLEQYNEIVSALD